MGNCSETCRKNCPLKGLAPVFGVDPRMASATSKITACGCAYCAAEMDGELFRNLSEKLPVEGACPRLWCRPACPRLWCRPAKKAESPPGYWPCGLFELLWKSLWCRGRDSNPHENSHYPLKIACLPVPPPRRRQGFYRIVLVMASVFSILAGLRSKAVAATLSSPME